MILARLSSSQKSQKKNLERAILLVTQRFMYKDIPAALYMTGKLI